MGPRILVAYIFDEFHHWFCSKVGVICRELKIETEVPPLRANRDCRYPEMRPWGSEILTMGVQPRGAQVRLSNGASINPASSTKTM
jgi:hypothetical protein